MENNSGNLKSLVAQWIPRNPPTHWGNVWSPQEGRGLPAASLQDLGEFWTLALLSSLGALLTPTAPLSKLENCPSSG